MTVVFGEGRGPIMRARDPLVGARYDESWAFMLLDMADRPIAELEGVEAGSLERSIHTEVRSAGSMTVADPQRVDWHRHRVGISYQFRDEAGQSHEYPLGVFLPTTPTTRHGDTGLVADVQVFDKMTMLARGAVSSTWSVDAGTSVVDAVAEVLGQVHETKISGPDDGGGNLTSSMVYDPGTPLLRIINDVLEAGNFFSIWVDGNGVWRLDPYIEPNRRGVEWAHETGANAVFEAEFEHEADGFDVPNVVIVTGKPEQDGEGNELPAPFGVARNEDPDDPFSVPSRGYEIARVEDDQDTVSEAVLGQLAARRLLELSSVTSTYRISHAWLPLDLNSAVRLRAPEQGVDALTVLQKDSWSWDAQGTVSLVRADLREVKQ